MRAHPDPVLALDVFEVLREALQSTVGAVSFASDQISYHTFTLAQTLATHQIDLEWTNDEEGAVKPPT